MNIIELAKEAGWTESTWEGFLTKFAALVRAEREWVDLTDEEIATVVHEMNGNEPTSPFWRDLIYEAIAAFKEKNK